MPFYPTSIGATTENPSFMVIAPLLSRCKVLVVHPLTKKDLSKVFMRALKDMNHGLGTYSLNIDEESLNVLAIVADGDARKGLNTLDIAATIVRHRANSNPNETHTHITINDVQEAGQQSSLRYDKNGEEEDFKAIE